MSIEEQVLDMVASQLEKKRADLKVDQRFSEDLGADSLDIVELVMDIEDKFGISIPDEEVGDGKMKTIADVVKFVEQKKAKS